MPSSIPANCGGPNRCATSIAVVEAGEATADKLPPPFGAAVVRPAQSSAPNISACATATRLAPDSPDPLLDPTTASSNAAATPSRPTNSATATTPDAEVNDASGAPTRTRPAKPGIFFTERVSFRSDRLVSRQPQSSLLAGHPFVYATRCCIPIRGSGSEDKRRARSLSCRMPDFAHDGGNPRRAGYRQGGVRAQANRHHFRRLGRPTPCAEWNVRQLVNHVVSHEYRYADNLATNNSEYYVASRDYDSSATIRTAPGSGAWLFSMRQ